LTKIITIAIPKGGVGKTTTAVNLAASLAVLEKRTLLIDTDPFGACSMSLGFTAEKTKGGIYEVFNFMHSVSQVIHRTDIAFLDFIPTNITSQQAEKHSPHHRAALRLRHHRYATGSARAHHERPHVRRFRSHTN